MRIAVLGGGFVGTTTAVVLAEEGHQVLLVEPDEGRRGRLAAGELPFYEPGLAEALRDQTERGRIRTRAALDLDEGHDIVYICVGTPSDETGAMDTRYIAQAAADVTDAAATWQDPFTVVVKSTVVPGTTRRTVLARLESGLGAADDRYGVAMNPEFLREGSALADARRPDRVVYGTHGAVAVRHLAALFGHHTCPVRATDIETAELCKYAANALLATKVGFANELARLAEAIGTDVDEVFETVGLDHRIAPSFLDAGPGFGGSCFPKDLKALAAAARTHSVELGIVEATLRSNDTQVDHVHGLLARALAGPAVPDGDRRGDVPLKGRRIVLLGAAFKPETDDVRESRTLALHERLVRDGATVVVHDPMARATYAQLATAPYEGPADLDEAVTDADALVLMTHWQQYVESEPTRLLSAMRGNVVIDTRRCLDEAAYTRAGARLIALGRGRPSRHAADAATTDGTQPKADAATTTANATGGSTT